MIFVLRFTLTFSWKICWKKCAMNLLLNWDFIRQWLSQSTFVVSIESSKLQEKWEKQKMLVPLHTTGSLVCVRKIPLIRSIKIHEAAHRKSGISFAASGTEKFSGSTSLCACAPKRVYENNEMKMREISKMETPLQCTLYKLLDKIESIVSAALQPIVLMAFKIYMFTPAKRKSFKTTFYPDQHGKKKKQTNWNQ